MAIKINKLARLLPAALVVFAAPGGAETLDEAWADALASHRQIQAAGAMRDAAAFELDEARAARLPRVDLSSAYSRLDEAPGFDLGGITTPGLFDGDDYVSAGAQVRVPVYYGGAISAGRDAAKFSAEAAEDKFDTVVQDIKLAAAEHFVGVLRAESAVAVARSYVESLKKHTENTRERYEVGDIPQNDYLATSVTLANAEQRLLEATNNLDYARASYNRFLGRPLSAPVALNPSLNIDQLIPTGTGLENLIVSAGQNRRELQALEAQANAFRRQADGERAKKRPQVSLTGGYMYMENEFLTDDEFWMGGLSVTWNLFDGGQYRKRSAALQRRAAAIDYNREDAETMISLQVRRAWNDRFEAENRLRVAESAVTQASENLRVVQNRYQAGASTNADVLDAEALREQSLSNRDNARFAVELAKVRLARSIGAL